MTLGQSIIVGLVYFLVGFSFFTNYTTYYRPILCGTIVGAVLGDIRTGAVLGAQINLIYIGYMSVGGSSPGDPALAGVVGVAFCIANHLDMEVGLALAVPVGLLGNFTYVFRMTTNAMWIRVAEKFINEGKEDALFLPAVVFPFCYQALLAWLPVTLLLYFGGNAIGSLADLLNGPVLKAVSVVGGMMPAIGIGINLNSIFKGNARIFLFVGFALAVFLGLNTIAVTIFGLAAAIIYTQLEDAAKAA
ncbi:MAG: PTS sugar transporter subunit IIC [Erysipelotrichaceae bacterium]|nr:PTS sugar transporter subunit IIC [Erysipelotrichaceae bacterium]